MKDKIESRIEKLESEILKYKRNTIIALVFSIICGGGGLLGLAKWITSMPKESKEMNKIQVETEKLGLEIIKDSLEISINKFNEFKLKHNSEIESISRQLELFKTQGSKERVKALTTLLIDKEQQFQALITSTSEMCRALAFQTTGNQQWIEPYMNRMQSIKQASVKSQQELEKLK